MRRSGPVLRTSALTGLTGVGGEIETPAIGPATLGLRGLRLFSASQPATTTARNAPAANLVMAMTVLFMACVDQTRIVRAGSRRSRADCPLPGSYRSLAEI